jgi:hypothetical protein
MMCCEGSKTADYLLRMQHHVSVILCEPRVLAAESGDQQWYAGCFSNTMPELIVEEERLGSTPEGAPLYRRG